MSRLQMITESILMNLDMPWAWLRRSYISRTVSGTPRLEKNQVSQSGSGKRSSCVRHLIWHWKTGFQVRVREGFLQCLIPFHVMCYHGWVCIVYTWPPEGWDLGRLYPERIVGRIKLGVQGSSVVLWELSMVTFQGWQYFMIWRDKVCWDGDRTGESPGWGCFPRFILGDFR